MKNYLKKQGFLIISIILVTVSHVFSTSYTWTGSSSSSWSNSSNWSPLGVPGAGDEAVVTAAVISPVLSTNITLSELVIVSGNLDLNGNTLSLTGQIISKNSTLNNGSLILNAVNFEVANSTINTTVTGVAATVNLTRTVFNGSVIITKNGASSDFSYGNTFNSTFTFTLSGSGYYVSGAEADIFNGDVQLNNAGTNAIFLAYSGSGTQFNGNIVLTSTGNNVIFGYSGGTSTLANGKTISVGVEGFNGPLIIQNLTQLGNTAQSLSVTGTIQIGQNSIFNGNLTVESTQMISLSSSTFNGSVNLKGSGFELLNSTFNGTLTAYKVGSTNDVSGGNIFNGSCVFTNAGTGYLAFGIEKDLFNGDVTFNNFSDNGIFVGFVGSGTELNGDVVLNNTNNGTVWFGKSGGDCTLADGQTISIGSDGFNGQLYLQNFEQLGTTPQLITLSGSVTYGPNAVFNGSLTTNSGSLILYQNSIFNGGVSSISEGVVLNYSIFNGALTITKNGSSNDASNGGNVFNGVVSITQNGSGYFMMGNGVTDDFNSSSTFIQTGSGAFYLDYSNQNTTHAGDITVNSITPIVFGQSGGSITIDGNVMSINNTGSANPIFQKLIINTTGVVKLNTGITVSNELTLQKGKLITSASNMLTLAAGAIVTGGSAQSFIEGPVTKIGNTAFLFPVGKGTAYKPLSISAPSNSSDAFTAEYFNATQSRGDAIESVITGLSTCEFWSLTRNGNSNVYVTLAIDSATCNLTNLASMRLTGWNGTLWKSYGNGGSAGNSKVGSITSASQPTVYDFFTLAQNVNPCSITASLSSSVAGNTICKNQSLTFTASPAGQFQYDFFRNGTLIQSSTSNKYTASNFSNGEYVTVKVYSSLTCVSPLSNVVTVTVNPLPVVNAGADQALLIGYGSQTVQLSSVVTAGSPSFSYLWSSGQTTASINVSPTVTTTYVVSVTDSKGCTGSDNVTVVVTDIRCGTGNANKVSVCHKPERANDKPVTLCVSENAVPALLNQGDYLGVCKVARMAKNTQSTEVEETVESVFGEKVELNCFPNPAVNKVTLQFILTESGQATLEIYSITGSRIAVLHNEESEAGKQYSFEYSVNSLAGGIYSYRLTTSTGVYNKKIIVVKN